jgi:hypothetical protein
VGVALQGSAEVENVIWRLGMGNEDISSRRGAYYGRHGMDGMGWIIVHMT